MSLPFVLHAGVALAIATLVQLALRWAQRRLPLALSRRALGREPTHPDPRHQRLVDLAVLPAMAAVWAAAAWSVAGAHPALRGARAGLAATVASALTMPLFALQGRSYSALDVVLLPSVIALLWIVIGAATALVETRLLAGGRGGPREQQILGTFVRAALTGLGCLVVLQAWGIDVRAVAIVASVLGVGVGFGLQHLANNLVSGLVIGIERPIKPGDFVTVGEFRGTVARIGARCVEIVTRDRVSILIPNSRFLEQEIVNWSHGDPTCRLQVPVGLAYGSDVATVRAALLDAAARHPDVLPEPAPAVDFRGFGDSALLFELEVWTRDPRTQHELISDLHYRIEAALRRHGLSVPFPQRDLHLRSPDLAAIALAFARRHLGDDALREARAALAPPPAPAPAADLDTTPAPRTWDDAALDELLARLRGADGVAVRDRRHRLTRFPGCFIGREAVDWLVGAERVSRDEAVALGQRLVERGAIRHVLDEHPFRDGEYFYRFTEAGAAPARLAADAGGRRRS